MVTRVMKLPDERNVLLGKDLNNLFIPNMVYEAISTKSGILFNCIGVSSLPKHGHPSANSDNNTILAYGTHLITKEELDNLL